MSPLALPVKFADAWNAHDMPALAALFAPDARFVNVVGLFWKGRDEIEAAHAATHATIFKSSLLTILDTDMQELQPGCTAVHTRWQLAGHSSMDGKAEAARQGILLFVARRSAEGWEIAVAQNTDIVPGLVAPNRNS